MRNIDNILLGQKGVIYPLKFKFSDSFFSHTTTLWNNLLKNVRCKNISDFREYFKVNNKPPRYKHFSRENKLSNSLLTKIRVGRSDLNLHKFTIGLIDSPQCDCLFREESSSHYFLDCFLYSPERRILFDLIEHYIPKFSSYKKSQKLDIILKGFEIENLEFTGLNTTLTLAVQKFIMQTKRFYVPSSPL